MRDDVYKTVNTGARRGSAYILRKGKGRTLVHDLKDALKANDIDKATAVVEQIRAKYGIDETKMLAHLQDRREQRAHDAQKFNAELVVNGSSIDVKLAKKLALTPEWDKLAVKSATDQRKLIDEVKKRLAKWETEE